MQGTQARWWLLIHEDEWSPFSKPTSWGLNSFFLNAVNFSSFLEIWKVIWKKPQNPNQQKNPKAIRFKLSFLFPSHFVHTFSMLWQPPTRKVTRLTSISSSNQHLLLCDESQAMCIYKLLQTDLFWYTSFIVFSKTSQQSLLSMASASLMWQEPYFLEKN